MKMLSASLLMASLMAGALLLGVVGKGAVRAPVSAPKYVLEEMIPRQFGDWRELRSEHAQLVNPQTKQLIDRLYSQVLERTYVNAKGYSVMLSMAYGGDQRGELQAHKPEVCYPAQGFTLQSNTEGEVQTPFGRIAVRRLNTSLARRKEPLTYWFTEGDTPVNNRFEQRMVEIRLGLTGQIPDGLLVRVSSIDDMPQRAYEAQDAFVVDLVMALPVIDRTRLSGLVMDSALATR